MAKSFFREIEPVPIDETFRLLDQFNSDSNPNKVNLGIGGIVQKIATLNLLFVHACFCFCFSIFTCKFYNVTL